MNKKFFWLLVGLFFLFILLFALSRANGEQGGPSLGDAAWMTEVAAAYGAPRLFTEQLMLGASRGTPATLPAGTRLEWLVENSGRARRVLLNTAVTGWRYAGDVAGQEVIFFYPADKSFLFAVVEKTAPETQTPGHQMSGEIIEVAPMAPPK